MTVFIFKAIVILLAVILFFAFAAWLGELRDKDKVRLLEQIKEHSIDKVSSLLTSKIALMMEQYKTGPWYLVVYTHEANHTLWISNNNIRSVHPDVEHRKLIIKLFNGEDMVIEHVDNYELCAANEIGSYDM